MEFEDKSKMQINRRLLYIFLLLFIIIPVVVGVLVWHFTKDHYEKSQSSTDSIVGGEETTLMTTTHGYYPDQPWRNLRLPRTIVPVHYDITLYPDFYEDNGWFYGNETITIRIDEPSKYILVHYKYMNITRTVLTNHRNGNVIAIAQTFSNEENQFWVVETEESLAAGTTVDLFLQFDGSLTNAIVGFYKSTYVNSQTNETRNLATSKFEPVDARRAFPCFDEPNIKAEYTIHLIHRPEYTPLSNMPANSPSMEVSWSADLVKTSFQRSVKMSTYLVCFIVCDFKYLEATTSTNKTLRVYATPDKIDQAQYALDVGKHTMEYYEQIFELPYPLPKQDMIAIPDFVSGAMEHWGLITYRETNLLYDESSASSTNKQRVATVIAHEVAHQWFGNIVTMDWWDDLWLNEGFASFMEYFGVDTYETDWDMMGQFAILDPQPVMVLDAGLESHPIVVPVQKPSEINEVFDAISYNKGSSVIRMIESIMGKDKFFSGVAKYLKKYEWGNAKTDDLWQTLSEVDGAPNVKHIMDTWTRQMGFPYINVTFNTETSNVGKSTVSASQRRFLSDANTTFDAAESEFGYKWYVSLNYITSDGTNGSQALDLTDQTFTINIDIRDQTKWIKFNAGQTGFYRVTYPDDIWIRFATVLANGVTGSLPMSAVDRSGLLDDAFSLAAGGYLSYDVMLSMTLYLDKEDSYIPWDSAATGINYISHMLEYGSDFGSWRSYVLARVKPALNRIGYTDTGSHLQKTLRVQLIDLACYHGDEDCLNFAASQFRNWLDNGIAVNPNLRTTVYKYGMSKIGTSSDWELIWQKYKTETVPQERVKLLYSLSQTKTIWLLSRYLDYANDPDKVRSQDFFTVIIYIAQNPAGNNLAWNWVRENWPKLVDRFTLYSRHLGRLVPSIISGFNSEFRLQEVTSFFEKYPDAGSGSRARRQALEKIAVNVNWMTKYSSVVIEWLK
ncbi:glutamyl aminopeptidase [Patella vulgata]|uniref:glutamyl aminopeptidase n=1 Tax=Patella vulgata TaxID=6465 RepID=UPI0024A8D91F|nr:glutamyl aminopeptidase [Patella vulgata]